MGPYRSNYLLSHLDVLEAESVHIMLEVAAESERPLRGRLSSPAILRGTSSVRPTTFPSGQLRLVRSRPRFPKDSNRKWCPAAPEWPAPGADFVPGLYHFRGELQLPAQVGQVAELRRVRSISLSRLRPCRFISCSFQAGSRSIGQVMHRGRPRPTPFRACRRLREISASTVMVTEVLTKPTFDPISPGSGHATLIAAIRVVDRAAHGRDPGRKIVPGVAEGIGQ